MQRSTRDILFILAGLFLSIGTLWASKAAVETRLRRDVAYLNSLGRSLEGERSLTVSLQTHFRATPERITEMRRARLGYGDISAALALASHLKGGITKANVERLVALWRSPRFRGWGMIARSFGVRVERVVLQIESLKARPAASPSGKPAASADHSRSYDPVLRLVHGG